MKKIFFIFVKKNFVLIFFCRLMAKDCKNLGVDIILGSHRAFQPAVNSDRRGEAEEGNCLFVYGKVVKT